MARHHEFPGLKGHAGPLGELREQRLARSAGAILLRLPSPGIPGIRVHVEGRSSEKLGRHGRGAICGAAATLPRPRRVERGGQERQNEKENHRFGMNRIDLIENKSCEKG
jgi:hypothetical protein